MESGSDDDAKAPRYNVDLLKRPGMSFDIDEPDPKKRIQRYIDAYRLSPAGEFQGIDEDLMRNHIEIASAKLIADGAGVHATFAMKNSPTFSNRMGNMHGGAIAMVYDMCTTMCAAPLAKQDYWVFGGVSRTLSITFLRPVRSGMDLVIECEVLQQGQRLSTIRGVMKDRKNGKVLSVAEHNKASIKFEDPQKKHVVATTKL